MTLFQKHDGRNRILTAAHWGVYELIQGRRLEPFDLDDNPSRIGRGWVSAATDKATRVARPAVRRGWLRGDGGQGRCDDAFVKLPWDEALDLAAGALADVISEHGNAAIFSGSYGWASAGRVHHAQSQLRRFLNSIGGFTGSRDTYSHAAGEVLFPLITGMSCKAIDDGATSWPLIAENCTLFLAFGGMSGNTAQIASGGTAEHEAAGWFAHAAGRGMKPVLISPLRSDMAALPNARWIPIRPGSDVALILALSHELVTNRWHDEEFLARYTSGWNVYRTYLLGETDGQPKNADWAAPLCDIPAGQIRALAAELARERVMISTAWSLQRGDHGEQVIWSALALAALLGQIGLPGTGYGFGYGCTAMPGRPKRQIHWPAIPQGKNAVADFIPVARVCDMLLNPGDPYTYNCESRRYPDIRLVYWAGGNPFHHHQDLTRLSRAWTRPETIIVNEHSWTATARRADIVLPCTTPLERDDLMINRRDPRLIYLSQVLPIQGKARNDFDIFAGLADRLGTADAYTEGRDGHGWIRWLWDRCAETAHQEHGFDLPDFDTLRRDGCWTVPEADATRILFGDFIDDPVTSRLATETGRLTLYNRRIAEAHLPDCPGHPCWMAPAEWTINADPDQLHLISNQPATRLHSQLDNSASTRAAKQRGREICTMHPDAAHARGLGSGDIVRIFNDRGACLSTLSLDKQMREDCLVLPTGAWLDLQNTDAGVLCVHGNPNMLTLDKGTSGLAQGNIAHTTLVRVEKWTGTLPPVTVHDAPDLVEKDIEGADEQHLETR